MLGMGWIYGETTKVTKLDFVKKEVPYVEPGLMEYGYDKDQDETDEMTEENKEMEEAPMSRKDAMVQFNKLENLVEELAMMLIKENRDQKKPEGRAAANQEPNKGTLETSMSMEEERAIIEWIDSSPWVKESALL
eukprot:1915463-Heterocapsa_arctica.AAC.1